MDLLREINENDLVIDVSESIGTLFTVAAITQPSFITKGINAALKNPLITASAALVAMSAWQKYQQNKRYTARFFAKTPSEKKLYSDIVNKLVNAGGYRLLPTKHMEGGVLYTLRKK